jgi:hypothetical protein
MKVIVYSLVCTYLAHLVVPDVLTFNMSVLCLRIFVVVDHGAEVRSCHVCMPLVLFVAVVERRRAHLSCSYASCLVPNCLATWKGVGSVEHDLPLSCVS